MTHDKLCPYGVVVDAKPITDMSITVRPCQCPLIARARADERAKAHVHATGTSTGDGPCCECCYDVPALYALRAKVQLMYDNEWINVNQRATLADVLALIDEAQR